MKALCEIETVNMTTDTIVFLIVLFLIVSFGKINVYLQR